MRDMIAVHKGISADGSIAKSLRRSMMGSSNIDMYDTIKL